MTLVEKLVDIQVRLKAKKSSYNSFGKYYFRKAEDILEGLKPLLMEHKVTVYTTEDLIATDPHPVMRATAVITDGKDEIKATAVVGVDLAQKGMQVGQQYGATSTYGKKYALGNLFMIDDTEDADAINTHGKSAGIAAKAKSKMTEDQLNKAIEFVKGGGDINKITAKYDTTPAQLKKIKAAKK